MLGSARPGTEVSPALRAQNPKRVREESDFGLFSDSFGVPGPKGPETSVPVCN